MPKLKPANTFELIDDLKDTAHIFRRHGRLSRLIPKMDRGVVATLGGSRTFQHTRRRLAFYRGGRVHYLALGSRNCPNHLHRYSSTPLTLFCQKGTSLGTLRIVGVMKAHRTAPCKRSVYAHFLTSLSILYPGTLVIDKLTCNVSVRTRHTTLRGRFGAVNILTRKLSHVCPTRRQGATIDVLRRKNLLARFADKAGPSERGFIGQGHVITNVDSTAIIVRSTTGKKTLVATRLTRDCRQSYFTFPKQYGSRCSVNYGGLVEGGRTILVASTRSLIGTVK